MAVEITQDEMNILNLNGISAEDVRSNIEYSRATGLDDNTIRQQYSNTINELRPLTKVSANDTAKIKQYQDKGAITPFEYAKRKSVTFDRTYNNIKSREQEIEEFNQRHPLLKKYGDWTAQNRANSEKAAAEREERLKNGTATKLDKFIDKSNEWGEANYKAQLDYATKQADAQMPHKDDPNYRYKPYGVDVTGRVLYSETDLRNKIDFGESFSNSFVSGSWIPFVGGYVGKADAKKEREIAEHIRKGEQITQSELDFINHRREQAQEESVRGYTWGGDVAKGFLPSLIRFGTEIATGTWVLRGLGLATEAPATATIGQKVVHGLSEMAKTGAVNTLLPHGWDNIYEAYQERMLNNEIQMQATDKAEWLFKESDEKPAVAFAKSLGQVFIMFASEASGELLNIPIKGASAAATKYIGSPIGKYLKSNKILKNFVDKAMPEFSKLYEKMNGLPIKGESLDWLKSKVKFDGFLEELGEEVVEDVLNLTIGTNNEERSLENYAKAIFKSPDEWAVLAGAVALQGGTLSVASHVLGSHLEKNGATDEQIIDVLQNLSEQDKENIVEQLIQNNEINIDKTTEQKIEESIGTVTQQLLNSGKFTDEAKAEKAARLGVNILQNMSEKTGLSTEQLIADDMAEIQEIDKEMYADENGVLHGGVSVQAESINDRITSLLDDYDALGDDYDDVEDLDFRIKELSFLETLQSGEPLSIEEIEFGNDLISRYEENGDAEFAKQLKEKMSGENKQTHFQRADFAGAEGDELISAAKEWKEKGTESSYFKKWSGDTPVVESDDALKYDFKTGKGVTVKGFHGTKRADRVGSMFLAQRATSGPMAFFSSSKEIATNYSTGKEDTSLRDELNGYEDWFKIKINGRNVRYDRAWWSLTSEQRRIITENAPHVTQDDMAENIIFDENKTSGVGNYDYNIKRYRGNALMALLEEWLNSGTLYGDEGQFVDVLKLAGLKDDEIFFVDPNGDYSGVYEVYLSMQKPLVTNNIPKRVLTKLEKQSTKQPIPESGYSVDAWDKRTKDPIEWINNLKEDIEKGENSFVWTAIPDWVTDVLKSYGYDGIIDVGGKGGGEIHKVYVPFYSTQIKSVDNKGTFDSENPNIYFQKVNSKSSNNIENVFGDTAENITSYIKDDVINILADNNIDESEFKFEDIRIYGSYSTGKNKKTSDLDVIVQYSGSMREDAAFNLFADEKLYISDKNGNDIQVDINPVNSEISGTIDDNLEYFDSIDDRSINQKAYFQSAYHGTPHKFDEFSTENIGTGEGAQAHGWGLYFAADKGVSEEYRDNLTGSNKFTYDGKSEKELQENDSRLWNVVKDIVRKYNQLSWEFENLEDAKNEVIYINENTVKNPPKGLEFLADTAKEKLELLKNVDTSKIKLDKGQLFKVDIPDDNEMLYENGIFEEQPKIIQELFWEVNQLPSTNILLTPQQRANFKYTDFGVSSYKDMTGRDFYRALSRALGSDKEASLFLNKQGVKGIAYDGRSDGRCYVVFDDKSVKVLETYYQKSAKQRKILIDNDKSDIITNRLTKVKGSFIPAENLITLFKDADESTIIHEFAHWWLEKLVKYAPESEELQEDLKEIRKFVRNDGEPFTDEQHERFARGFEAYMKTGSAKTNRLKKLFEDFKNALLSLYDSIKNLEFDEEEIPEINRLFDRLLTTENQRVQSAVFDKCNEIQAQIQQIRDNQEKEFEEIEQIERDNLERNLRDKQRTQQINEYLRLAQKSASRVPKGVREYQDRCKKVTLDILETATGYKRQFIANPRNWEIIDQKIADIDDPFSGGNGMLPEWLEFYADTGVSYDNDDSGDYQLARQAFEKMIHGDYSMPQMEEEEIAKFFGMFDYLEGKVMTLRGENKSAAYEALTSLFNKLPEMPDDAMRELVDRLQDVGEKFIDQISTEKPNAKGIPNVSLPIQFRTYVTTKMHNMKAYDPDSKRVIRLSQVNKLYTLLKFANSVAETKQIIKTINNHAIEQLENRQKFILHKEIQKQVKVNSKLIKVGALKKGKFDWKTNTVFHELQELNRLSLEAAQKEYQRLINADSAILGEERESIEENPAASLNAPTEFQAILKTKFLEYKANRVRDLNLAATRSLLEDIMELKFEGRRAKNAEELKKALSRYDYQTNLVSIIYSHSNNKLAKNLTRWVAGDTLFTSEGTLANWESLLNAIFNKDTAQKYSLLKSESDTEVYAHKKCLEFYRKAMDIYGLNGSVNTLKGKIADLWGRTLDFDNTQPIIKLFQEYEDAGHTYLFPQYTFNKDTFEFVKTNIEITHAQLITLYAWSLNSELKKRIMVQFFGEPEDNDFRENEEKLEKFMFSKLSNQDKEFAQAMVDICDSMYADTNEVFIRTTGLSLPRVENYIPSKTERIGSDLDMMHECVLRSTNPSFIKQRKNCRRIKMEPVSPLEIILPHINKTARYIVMSEKVNFYNRIFQSPDVKAAIIDVYGKKSGTKIYRVLLNQLATSTYENYARSITVGKNLADTIASNYITSKIGGNLKVFLSQLTSVINYSENMPAGVWAKGFRQALMNPKETIDFMFNNCEYLQARLAGNSQNEIIASLTNEADRMRSLRNFFSSNTKYGDILAIIFGGKPYVDYLIKNEKVTDEKTGKLRPITQEEAFDRFVESTLRSQQSGHNSATSAWQKQQSQNAFTRMVFAFNNTNLQYERKWIDSISNYSKGDMSKQEFAKAFLIYKIFNPILFSSFLTNLSILTLLQNMFGGGDDDPVQAFGLDALTSIALSNWKAYGMLGVMANIIIAAVAAKAAGGKFFENSLPLISDFETSLSKLLNSKKLELADYAEMLAGVGDYASGVSTSRLYNAAGGIGDVLQGEFGKGLLRIIGYGKYRASVAATGQEPERKKRR